ncbi:MAG: tetratricopeptide repeat protein, partial [Planctomycetota bacterium]|nr:tetratricopeptide repeat protein [Planctomycetota bacterium]
LPVIPEENWTKGMMLAPKRTIELLPMWATLGEQSFKTFGQEFDRFYREMISQKRSQPRQKVGPYTLYRIGQRHLEERRHQSALAISKFLLRKYPSLVPALELRIEALAMAKNTSHLGPATVLERLRLVGADAKSQEYLSAYPAGRFTKQEQLEIIRTDAYGIGRARIAQWLFQQGQPERVLLVLRPIPDLQDPPALQALRLQALFETDQFEETIEESKAWLAHPSIGRLSQRLTIRSQLALGDRDGVAQGLRTLLKQGPRKPSDRRGLAYDLVEEGMFHAAAPILAQMDKRKGLRTPSTIEWRGLCASATGQPLEAKEFLTRALPFFDNGRIEYLQLVQSAGDRDWPSLPLCIQRLEESDFVPTPFQAAGIALLGERLQTAIELARRGMEQNPNSLGWALMDNAARTLNNNQAEFAPQFGPEATSQARTMLIGTKGSRRDPRDTVAMLLAMEMAPWQTWTEVQAQAASAQIPNNLWLGWLTAEAQFRSGRHKQAHESVNALITQFPLCAPLWTQRFQILGALHTSNPLHPDVLAARADQMLAIPLRRYLSASEITLGLAGQAAAQGHADQAIATLRRFLAATGDQTEPESRWLLGRLLAEQGEYQLALDQFDRVLVKSKTRGLHPWVPEYLEWVAKFGTSGEGRVPASEIAERLEALVHRYPSDPHLALQRLIHRVEADQRSALLASDEALASLEMLRSLAPNNSIDALRPGSNRAWMEYLLSVSPILGEEYCQETLTKEPGNLDMWIGLSYSLHTQGRIAETRELVADLLKISDDPELHYRLAALQSLRGEAPRIVRQHLSRGDTLSGAKGNTPRNRFIQAQTTLLHGTGGLNQVVADLGRLWPDRNRFSRDVHPLELGRVYLTALVLRHQEADLRLLEQVAEDMLEYAHQDPYARDLIRSFRAVGQAIEARLLVETAQ